MRVWFLVKALTRYIIRILQSRNRVHNKRPRKKRECSRDIILSEHRIKVNFHIKIKNQYGIMNITAKKVTASNPLPFLVNLSSPNKHIQRERTRGHHFVRISAFSAYTLIISETTILYKKGWVTNKPRLRNCYKWLWMCDSIHLQNVYILFARFAKLIHIAYLHSCDSFHSTSRT